MRISYWLYLSPRFFSQTGTVVENEQAEVRLRGFALAFDRLANASTFFRLHLRDFLLVVVVLLVDHVSDQLIQSMRNSDPRVKLSLFADSILISTPYLPCR